MAIFGVGAATDGAVLGEEDEFPEASDGDCELRGYGSSQAKMNVAPFHTPFLDSRIKLKAVRGSGSRA